MVSAGQGHVALSEECFDALGEIRGGQPREVRFCFFALKVTCSLIYSLRFFISIFLNYEAIFLAAVYPFTSRSENVTRVNKQKMDSGKHLRKTKGSRPQSVMSAGRPQQVCDAVDGRRSPSLSTNHLQHDPVLACCHYISLYTPSFTSYHTRTHIR